jgi:glycosyltransferase involved in cell wall biosynthesis
LRSAILIFWEGYLDVAPTIVEWIKFLADKGISVKVYIADEGGCRSKVKETFDKKLVDVLNLSVQNKWEVAAGSVMNSRLFWKLFPVAVRRWNNSMFLRSINRFGQQIGYDNERYDVAYCVDATGLYSFKKSGIRAEKIINISLEILDTADWKRSEEMREIKKVERELLKHSVDRVIIQDTNRGEVLERTLGFSFSRFLFLPNSARRSKEQFVSGKYFHLLFNFDERQKILLSAGMVSESVCSLEIAKAMGIWNSDQPVKTVFHERMEIPENRGYYEKVRAAGKGKVFLSLKPVPFQEVHKIFSSADIGLAIYSKKHGDNFGVIGSASGKLFQYIKYGVPVIASDLPGLRELVLENDLGIVVDTPEEVPQAVEKILAERERYSNNARKAFEEKLNLDIYLEEVYQSIYN